MSGLEANMDVLTRTVTLALVPKRLSTCMRRDPLSSHTHFGSQSHAQKLLYNVPVRLHKSLQVRCQ